MRCSYLILCVGEGRPTKDHFLLILIEMYGCDVTGFNMMQRVALLV